MLVNINDPQFESLDFIQGMNALMGLPVEENVPGSWEKRYQVMYVVRAAYYLCEGVSYEESRESARREIWLKRAGEVANG